MAILIAFAIILLDQILKFIVIENIVYGATIGSWIRITNIANTGAAYSIRNK